MSKRVAYGHDEIKRLDPTCDDDSMDVQIYWDRNIAKCKYARSIVDYEVGTILSKHCAPWGENTLLCNASFSLSKKVYGSNGIVNSVIIYSLDAGNQYLLGPAFFSGWCDGEALDKYFDDGRMSVNTHVL